MRDSGDHPGYFCRFAAAIVRAMRPEKLTVGAHLISAKFQLRFVPDGSTTIVVVELEGEEFEFYVKTDHPERMEAAAERFFYGLIAAYSEPPF